MKSIYICFFLLLLSILSHAQYLSASLQLAEKLRIDERYEEAIIQAKTELAKGLKEKGRMRAVQALQILNNIYANQDNYKQAMRLQEESLQLAMASKDSAVLAYAYYAKAYTHYSIDSPDELVKYSNLSLKCIGSQPSHYLMAKNYLLLYGVHSNWNHEKEVNLYADKALEQAMLSKDFNLISNCYFALSVANEFNYNSSKAPGDRNKIVEPLDEIIKLHDQYGDRISNKILTMAYVNKASYYLNYFPENDTKAREMALFNAKKALEEGQKVKYNQELIASAYGLMSVYAMRDHNLQEAEGYLLKAYEVMHSLSKVYNYSMLNILNGLVDLYDQNGNYKKAFQYQKEATEYNQKLFDTEQVKSAQKLDIQFETEKKNSEIKLLAEKASGHRKQNILFIALIVIALAGSFFMFRSYNYRLKYSLEREKQLHAQKQEAELQAKLEREEQERLKAEQTLLTYQQQQLQKEAMAGALHLEHKNEVLHSLKKRLEISEVVNIQKIIREENLVDVDFEKAIYRIKDINPGFFAALSERAQQKLTPLDLKYCAYLHLDMDTKQIATLLSVEPKSVRMTKYRLKQKLNLDKDQELGAFLRAL